MARKRVKPDIPEPHKANVRAFLRRLGAGHCEEALVLADYLDEHDLPCAKTVRRAVAHYQKQVAWICRCDVSRRRRARWEMLVLELWWLRHKVRYAFVLPHRKAVPDERLWRLNKHLFNIPELAKGQ